MTTARKPNSRNPQRRPGKPAAARTDYDAISAEADLEPYIAFWRGRDWSLTHKELLDTWDLTAEQPGMSQNEQLLMILELAMGEEQWEEFRASGPLPIGILEKICEDYAAHCGIDLGESVGSGRS